MYCTLLYFICIVLFYTVFTNLSLAHGHLFMGDAVSFSQSILKKCIVFVCNHKWEKNGTYNEDFVRARHFSLKDKVISYIIYNLMISSGYSRYSCWTSFFNHLDSCFNGDNNEILIRILHYFLNIIFDCFQSGKPTVFTDRLVISLKL